MIVTPITHDILTPGFAVLTAAIFFSAYDIELLSDKMPSPDESVFGFGTMPPNSKVPCRIRRRQV